MPANCIFSKACGDGITRIVEVETTKITETEDKTFASEVKLPVTNKNQGIHGNAGPIPYKYVDLLWIKKGFELKGKLDKTKRTTLNGTIDSSVTTITVTAGANLDSASVNRPAYIQIGDEIIEYTEKSSNDLSGCTRGYGGTTAASHTTGVDIYHPAFHYKRQLSYINASGGQIEFYCPEGGIGQVRNINNTDVEAAPPIGNITSWGVTYSNVPLFYVFMSKLTFNTDTEDAGLGFSDIYDFSCSLTCGIDLLS